MARTSTKAAAAELCCAPVGSPEFDMASAEETARGFAALADPVRLHLYSLVSGAGSDGVCVCDLVGPSGRSQPTVSHHLRILREAGLVASERRGTWVWYSAQPAQRASLRAALD